MQAFREHKIVDIFHSPGKCDLTANVDFAYLRESLEGVGESFSFLVYDINSIIASAQGPISQAKFLLSLGLEPRLAKLLASAPNDEQRERIRGGAMRLISSSGMGSQYQVMGIVPEDESKDVYPFSAVTPSTTKA